MKNNNNSSNGVTEVINTLWRKGFFRDSKKIGEINMRLNSLGENPPPSSLSSALKRAKFLTRKGKPGALVYIQKNNPINKIFKNAEHNLFNKELIIGLGSDFKEEVNGLKINFGHSGTCTAFLLRKILEKLIYLTFARNGLVSRIESGDEPGRLIGLDAMINIASTQKINGTPFLTPRTAKKVQGIKFLGDLSAHNPLVDVDMETIIPQLPFIITAYKELVVKKQ